MVAIQEEQEQEEEQEQQPQPQPQPQRQPPPPRCHVFPRRKKLPKAIILSFLSLVVGIYLTSRNLHLLLYYTENENENEHGHIGSHHDKRNNNMKNDPTYGDRPPANENNNFLSIVSSTTTKKYSSTFLHSDATIRPLNTSSIVEVHVHDNNEKQTDKPRRKLPTPILVVGLPKTGTSTVYQFFVKSGYDSSHYKCGEKKYFCGLCMKVAVEKNKPPLKSCGNYEMYAQMDVELSNKNKCHFPQISNLEEIHQEAPNATLILTKRNMDNWARSVTNWVGGANSMAKRLARCPAGVGPVSHFKPALITWHEEHVQRIRQFVLKYPSHTLIEINIEDPNAGRIMARAFDSNETYWGHENDSLKTNASITRMKIRQPTS